jgi:hypothetical protein
MPMADLSAFPITAKWPAADEVEQAELATGGACVA